VGGEALWQSIDRLRFYNPGRSREDSLLANDDIQQRGQAVFAIENLEITPQWSATACGRWDYLFYKLYDQPFKDNPDLTGRKSFQRATGRAGLAWTARPELNLYANWGQGFLPPSTEELVNNPNAFGGFNQSMEPATSQGTELGARGTVGQRFSYELCGFQLDTHNDIDRYRIASRPGLTFYRNSGTSQRYGVESRLVWKPLRALALDGAYTYSHFHYTAPAAIDGNALPNSPEHQFDFDAEYSPVASLTLGVDTQMQSDWQLDTQNSASVPGYALWGASVTWRWRMGGVAGEATLAGRNLFGASYMAYTEPDPDGNSYQPGPKQEYFARIRLAR
jgi:iron complex outermembrane receptor protein